ncbi:MAG: hypothetical protein C4308_12030 [Chitinophagaceae bacterium]
MKLLFDIGTKKELNAASHVLLIETGENHFAFAIAGYDDKLVKRVGYFLNETDDDDFISSLRQQYPFLNNQYFKKVNSCYLPDTLLLPAKFFKADDVQKIYEAVYGKGQQSLVSEPLEAWQVYFLYRQSAIFHNHPTDFLHAFAVTLKSVNDLQAENLLVDFKTDRFSVVAIREGKLLAAQIYSYTTGEDVLYWLLKICRQFSFSLQSVYVELGGLIEKNSAMYELLHQYFHTIHFSGTNGMKLAPELTEYPEHFFSSLYKLVSCVL